MWWLSFADPDRPEGTQFLGAAIVRAMSFLEAVQVAHHLGINSGGEVQSLQIPPEMKIPEKWIERLLTKAECEEFDTEMLSAQVQL
jgi:hypothetical protein